MVVRGPQSGWTLLQGASFDRPRSSLCVLGLCFSLALLFDGLGLIVIGVGGRRIVSMAEDQRTTGELPGAPTGEDQNRSKG